MKKVDFNKHKNEKKIHAYTQKLNSFQKCWQANKAKLLKLSTRHKHKNFYLYQKLLFAL